MLISARFLTAGPCVDRAVYLSVPIRTRSFVPARTVSSLPFTALTFGLARHGILKQPFNLDSWGCFRESPTLSRGCFCCLSAPTSEEKTHHLFNNVPNLQTCHSDANKNNSASLGGLAEAASFFAHSARELLSRDVFTSLLSLFNLLQVLLLMSFPPLLQ